MKNVVSGPPPIAQQSRNPDDSWLDFVTNTWSRTVVQPILIAAMNTALVTGPLTILAIIIPGHPWQAFALVSFIIALEGVYTTIWLGRPGQRGINHFAYRAAEFAIIALMLRFLAWFITGSWPDLSAWRTYLFEPLTFFEDFFFLVTVITAFLVWQRTIHTSAIFTELKLDRAEASFYSNAIDKHQLETRPIMVNRGQLVAAFFQQWLWGGLILVFCAAISTFDLSDRAAINSPFALARLPLPAPLITALITYFLSGFLLLSQGRLAMLNARWLINGAKKGRQVERNWYRYSLRLLVIFGFLAAFLPLGSTIGLSRIIAALVGVVTAVVSLFWLLILLLTSLFTWLLPSGTPNAAPPSAPPPTPALPTPVPQPLSPVGDAAAMVFSAAFWAIVIVMTIIAVGFFLRDRGFRLDGRWLQRLWAFLTQWGTGWQQAFSEQLKGTRQSLRQRLARRRKEAGHSKPAWRFIRLTALSPREQLRYFYLSTVRRAREKGVEREGHETPLEYAQDLKENWPESAEDVEILTDAFLQARYSSKPIPAEDVGPVKQPWKRLRSRLRSHERGETQQS